MRLALAIAFGCLVQENGADTYYRFKVGTSWSFEVTKRAERAPKLTKLDLKVVRETDGRVELESKSHRGEGDPAVESLRWHVADGLLTWTEFSGAVEKESMRFYRVGSKKGDTWEWKMRESPAKATNLGAEEVSVAAGKYKDALHVRCEIKEGGHAFTMDIYLASGVGPVKMAAGMGEGDQTVLELKEFTPAK